MNLKKQKHGLFFIIVPPRKAGYNYHNIQYYMEQKEETLLCVFDGLYNVESIFVHFFICIFSHMHFFFPLSH